ADAIEFLRDVTGRNIFVNWNTIEESGITRDARVDVTLRDVRFSQALKAVLQGASSKGRKLGYATIDGIVTVSTEEDLKSNTIVQVYDIRDMLVKAPDFIPPPDFSLTANGHGGANRASRNRGGGPGTFGGKSDVQVYTSTGGSSYQT
ncbi:hypothetical protein GWI34_43870, partial [Actinomadura sp. DSM 109109]|nr:hypothetical protein [Actinomadura lepetitiana]